MSSKAKWNCCMIISVVLVIVLLLQLKVWFSREDSLVSATVEGFVVIVDAGHGGEDGGAVGINGSVESHINLQIAMMLEELLVFYGTDVLLLRDSDISLHDEGVETVKARKTSDLQNRVAMVNQYDNGLLLSIHQNFYIEEQYFGAQVFYAGRSSEDSMGLEEEIAKDYAESLQKAFQEQLNPENHREAKLVDSSLYLMNHVQLPAVLIECGFLSNGVEAELLAKETYQLKIACIIAGSIFQREMGFI